MTLKLAEIVSYTSDIAAPAAEATPYTGPAFPLLDAEIASAAETLFSDVSADRQLLECNSISVRLLRNWIADLRDAVFNADLADAREFSAIMNLMIGLGLTQRDLARGLGIEENTVSRYSKGYSAPTTVAARRGVAVETYRFLQGKVCENELPILKMFERRDAVRC